jgi:hypothetical protein
MMNKFAILTCCLSLVACGGGSNDSNSGQNNGDNSPVAASISSLILNFPQSGNIYISEHEVSIDVTTNISAELHFSGLCAGRIFNVSAGQNTLSLNQLAQGHYDNCTVRLKTSDGEFTDNVTVPTFIIDTQAPELTINTHVASLINNALPSFTLTSNEAGQIEYLGQCQSAMQNINANELTEISLNTLVDGVYQNCQIKVVDVAGNESAITQLNDFTIDTQAPVLVMDTDIATLTKDTTPTFTFSSNEAGSINYLGACSAAVAQASAGQTTVVLNVLTDGRYDDCAVFVIDSIGNTSAPLTINTFAVDSRDPVLTEVSMIARYINITTPSYTFHSNEAGQISYDGSCSSKTTAAAVGNNKITFEPLLERTINYCAIKVTDTFGNTSQWLVLDDFTVDLTAPILIVPEGLSDDFYSNRLIHLNFSANEIGTLTMTGGCNIAPDSQAQVIENSLLINPMIRLGEFNNCSLVLTDRAGNESTSYSLGSFRVLPSLNDTGMVLCGDDKKNNLDCATLPNYPNQDGTSGRDVLLNADADADGVLGLSYSKLDAQGNELALDESQWSCVHDNITGLIWEVKADDGGLRDKNWQYTWYNSTGINDSGDPGSGDTGIASTTSVGSGSDNCADSSRCDTEKFVVDVNANSLCGHSDWRMPTVEELMSLATSAEGSPTIDLAFFPNTMSATYYSIQSHARSTNYAWLVNFQYGYGGRYLKSELRHIRLVRSGQ